MCFWSFYTKSYIKTETSSKTVNQWTIEIDTIAMVRIDRSDKMVLRFHENDVFPFSRASRKIDVAALSAMLGVFLLQTKRLPPRPRPLLISRAIVVAVGAPRRKSPKTSKQGVSGVDRTNAFNRNLNRLCACQRS